MLKIEDTMNPTRKLTCRTITRLGDNYVQRKFFVDFSKVQNNNLTIIS